MNLGVTVFQVLSVIISILAFAAAFWLYKWVASQPSSNQKIAEIGKLIRNGANTFLAKEFKSLTRFCIVAAILIFLFLPSPIWSGKPLDNVLMTLSYLFGTVFSAIAGKVGISIATIANVKSVSIYERHKTFLYVRFPWRRRNGNGCSWCQSFWSNPGNVGNQQFISTFRF